MNSETVAPDRSNRQAINHTENLAPQIRGIKIVRSAVLSIRFFHDSPLRRDLTFSNDREFWERRVAKALSIDTGGGWLERETGEPRPLKQAEARATHLPLFATECP
jgi:hypothetical protein